MEYTLYILVEKLAVVSNGSRYIKGLYYEVNSIISYNGWFRPL